MSCIKKIHGFVMNYEYLCKLTTCKLGDSLKIHIPMAQLLEGFNLTCYL